jgi:hypothetical protein
MCCLFWQIRRDVIAQQPRASAPKSEQKGNGINVQN